MVKFMALHILHKCIEDSLYKIKWNKEQPYVNFAGHIEAAAKGEVAWGHLFSSELLRRDDDPSSFGMSHATSNRIMI